MNILSIVHHLLSSYAQEPPQYPNAVFLGTRNITELRSQLESVGLPLISDLTRGKIMGLSIMPLNIPNHISIGFLCEQPQVIKAQEQSPLDSVPLKCSSDMAEISKIRLRAYLPAADQDSLDTDSGQSTSPEPKP